MTLASPAASDTALTADTVANENLAVRQGAGNDNVNPMDNGGDVSLPPVPDLGTGAETAPPLSKREEIALRARQRRQERDGADDTDLTLAATGDQIPPFLANQPADEPANDDTPAPAADEPKTYTLKIRGNEIKVDRAELRRLADVEDDEDGLYSDDRLLKWAQKNAAADSYLEEAKQLQKSARLTAREEGDTPPTDAVTDPRDTVPPAPQHQEESLDDVVRSIQYDDPEEAAAKLRDAIARTTQATLTERDISERTAKVSTSIDEAAAAFEAANTDIASDPDKSAVLYGRFLMAEFRKDLIATGAPAENVDKLLAGGLPAALDAYKAVTVSGRGNLRTPAEMLESAGQSFRAKFAPGSAPQPGTTTAPAPVAGNNARLEAKRGLSPQPSRTAAPAAIVPRVDGQSPKARSSVVQEMLKRRGRA